MTLHDAPPRRSRAALCLASAALLLAGTACFSDLGIDVPTDELDAVNDAQEVDTSPPPDTTSDEDAADADVAIDVCDDSPPSTTVDVYVWADNKTFYFTPTPANQDMSRLYVPANALVRLRLATSYTENAHVFAIGIASCEVESPMGTVGDEVELEWKAPRDPGIYDGGSSPVDANMTFQVVVL